MLTAWLSPLLLLCVVVCILWRPRRVNEAVPAAAGAALLLASGVVHLQDLAVVLHVVSGAGLTILATLIMSAVLERAGFFRWAAVQVARKARGSGRRLFGYTLLLCFCMTLFFNNDGSILITTPILLELTQRLGFSKQQALPYLLGGCLVATSASAPIGVSNLANLIALSIVGLDLNQYAVLMLVPSLLGIAICCALLYALFARQLPATYTLNAWLAPADSVRWFPPAAGDTWHLPRPQGPPRGPLKGHPRPLQGAPPPVAGAGGFDPFLCRAGIAVVVLVRAGFFLGAAHGLSVQWVALGGATVLLVLYGWRRPRGVWPLLRTAPWSILLFAFAMYTLVYAFHQQGYTQGLAKGLQYVASAGLWPTVLATGGLLTVLSCLFNNLPSVMVGVSTNRAMRVEVLA
ncbi:MAG: arsenic transporter [Alicyclobacillus sp.]|nr:arsenic transporter [Alicyclobacillus sp.]